MEAHKTAEMHPKEGIAAPEKIPAHWWSIVGKCTREGALKKIAACTNCPSHWRLALTAEIDALAPEFNSITLHCHYHEQHGHATYHIGMTWEALAS